MPTDYPGAIDDFTNPQPTDPQSNPSHSGQHDDANDAIEAIEATLGVNPQGAYDDVAARLDDITPGVIAAADVTADSTNLVGVGTDVQAVLEELDNGVADHLADTTAAHAASAVSFSPTGTIAATDVQAAIAEVASEAAGGGFAKIAAAAPNAAIIDFTSIPNTYKHLMLILTGRGNAAVDVADTLMRLGTGGGAADTGANYDRQYLAGSPSSASAGVNDAQTSIAVGNMPGTSGTASRAGSYVFFFPDYAGTTFHKSVWCAQGQYNSNTTSIAVLLFGQWRNTAAIDRIALHYNAIGTGFVNGTVATLYGLVA